MNGCELDLIGQLQSILIGHLSFFHLHHGAENKTFQIVMGRKVFDRAFIICMGKIIEWTSVET